MSARVTEAMVEIGARASATRHYMERFRAPPDNPQVRMNADANWYLFADEARTVLTAVLSTEPGEAEGWQPTHRHKKRGTLYRYIGRAVVQARVPLEDEEYAIVYQDRRGQLWVRDPDEFNDGRFETLPAAPLPEDTHHGR